MSNDEPTQTRATRRGGRAQPTPAPGPRDLHVGPDLGETDGPVEDTSFDIRDDIKRGCTICDYAGVRYDEFADRKEFLAHIDRSHAKNAKAIREGQQRIACVTHCTWLCSTCGAESYYPTIRTFGAEGITHGGPSQRSYDRRFGFAYCKHGRYPAHKRAFGKIASGAGPVVLYHEGMTFSEQPIQDDESLKEFLPDEKSVPQPTKRASRAKRGQEAGKAIRSTLAKNRVLGTGERTVRVRRGGRGSAAPTKA